MKPKKNHPWNSKEARKLNLPGNVIEGKNMIDDWFDYPCPAFDCYWNGQPLINPSDNADLDFLIDCAWQAKREKLNRG